ncbi:LytTR family DNA-binding domain-containing protein [Aquimarina sp. 2201CG5-10]|uniref:LytR/AlgR family response regulator transcription factor n=1 Tax=Aquimarina callyspongiae TaxID=3098150 RepID=UPI002AB51603|nr:LytTR family DNA-binding domain-containing protein [Aquimarina sp. 2201CG5-10]MDY8136189.1 LytTR family DNA-binding domain-containing protein [Aquimarina sp. 2201CG5-10]
MSNPISCFIVEDDPQALQYATSIIQEYGQIDILGHSESIHEAASLIKKIKPDFILLDVFLTDGTAFDFLKSFDNIEFRIIFTTSFAKYAIDAFRFSAIDYLLKPYDKNELLTALEKVSEDLHKKNYQIQLDTLLHNFSNSKTLKKIVLKNADAIHVIALEDILFARSDNNYTTFHLSGKTEILVSQPLKSYDKKLKDSGFFRVHQSYLINLIHISLFDKRNEEVILKQSHRIPVAQSRKKSLIDYLDTLF